MWYLFQQITFLQNTSPHKLVHSGCASAYLSLSKPSVPRRIARGRMSISGTLLRIPPRKAPPEGDFLGGPVGGVSAKVLRKELVSPQCCCCRPADEEVCLTCVCVCACVCERTIIQQHTCTCTCTCIRTCTLFV